MAATQSSVSSSTATREDRRFSASVMPSHASPRGPASSFARGNAGNDEMRGTKRRLEVEEDSHPYPSSHAPRGSIGPRMPAAPGPPAAYSRPNGGPSPYYSSSPRTQLPPFNSLPSMDNIGRKRRETDSHTEGPSASHSHSEPPYDVERYRYSHRAASQNGQPSPSGEDRGYPAYSRPRQSLHSPMAPPPFDDHYQGQGRTVSEEIGDSSLPLARRRGDAAHAKVSRLQIDVPGVAADGRLAPHQLPRNEVEPGMTARSAPPTKVTFGEQDGPPYEARGPANTGYYQSGHNAANPPGRPSPGRAYGQESGPIMSPSAGGRSNAPLHSQQGGYGGSGGEPLPPPHRASLGGPAGSTPVTGRFVPQTASIPSPAYHSTRFTQGGGPPGAPPPPNGVARTAIPQPPPTARLPDHLRSPPSSKTQFLSLFSNFYDSLSDSRTLKATLEDQVRRSNTLLQTLQKSSKVLEATVDKKMKEERLVWEAKVKSLEERIKTLEAEAGVKPTPSSAPASASASASPAKRPNAPEAAEADQEMADATAKESTSVKGKASPSKPA